MCHHPSHPANKVSTLFPFPFLLPRGCPSSEQLQHDDAEAVDVAFRGGLHCQALLWRYVPKCTGNVGADMGLARADYPREAEIRDPWLQVSIQQNVARLHVSVDDMGHKSMVQEREPPGRTDAYLQAVWPSECFDGVGPVPEPRLKTPVLHVLVLVVGVRLWARLQIT